MSDRIYLLEEIKNEYDYDGNHSHDRREIAGVFRTFDAALAYVNDFVKNYNESRWSSFGGNLFVSINRTAAISAMSQLEHGKIVITEHSPCGPRVQEYEVSEHQFLG